MTKTPKPKLIDMDEVVEAVAEQEVEEARKQLPLELIKVLDKFPKQAVIPCLIMELIVAYNEASQETKELDGTSKGLLRLVAHAWETIRKVQVAEGYLHSMEDHPPSPVVDKQAANVKQIADAFNEVLERYQLSPMQPIDNDRNIFKSTTELAYQVGDNRLMLVTPDEWLEDTDKLEAYLTQTVLVNLSLLRDADSKTEHKVASDVFKTVEHDKADN